MGTTHRRSGNLLDYLAGGPRVVIGASRLDDAGVRATGAPRVQSMPTMARCQSSRQLAYQRVAPHCVTPTKLCGGSPVGALCDERSIRSERADFG